MAQQIDDGYTKPKPPKGRNYGGTTALPKAKATQPASKPKVTQPASTPTIFDKVNPYQNWLNSQTKYNNYPQLSTAALPVATRPMTIQDRNPDYHTTPFSFYGSGRPMGAGMNLTPEDYLALPDAMYNQAAMAARANSRLIDTRFPMGINSPEEAVSDLPDNYPWLFPEVTGEETGADTTGDTGYGGGYPETPYDYLYPEWGGGGYNKYFRDNGLINWRI